MGLTENESVSLQRTAFRLEELRQFFEVRQSPNIGTSPHTWFKHLADIKAIQGNFSNDLSFVSCLMAKEYLLRRFEIVAFDVALKPQGAQGLDVDEQTVAGGRVIGEIKTTTPHHGVRFGAAQISSLKKDFAKLQLHKAEHKFMFVTDDMAFNAIKQSFCPNLRGVKLVCLTSGDEHDCDF